jgi:hypothetical protein
MTYAHDEMDVDESAERDLFALRARVATNDAGPPPLATVLAAIERARATRKTRTIPRVVIGALAAAACTAALFAAARVLSPAHERIVAERGDASAPFAPPRAADTEGEGASVCTIDRSIAESSDDTCASSPAPLASYAALEPICVSVPNSGGGPRDDGLGARATCDLEATCSIALP